MREVDANPRAFEVPEDQPEVKVANLVIRTE